jgi:hypothetical protein
MISNFDPM